MPIFETTIPVNAEEIQKLLALHWKLKLGKLIKASKNHTFQAFSEDGQKKYSVRVTPDPEKKHIQRITDELFFVDYLVKAGLDHFCAPISPVTESTHKTFLAVGDLIIAVFQWAQGSPFPPTQLRWTNEEKVIKAWGRFFGRMHQISRNFSKDHPDVVKRMQRWDEINCQSLKGLKISPLDQAVVDDPQHYGALHGDLNVSNFHYVDEKDLISAFDTDQYHVGWYLYDVAQACLCIVLLETAGIPFVGTMIEGISSEYFIDKIIEGYETYGEKVDRGRLLRMIEARKQFLVRFAKQALLEGNVPKDMQPILIHTCKNLAPKWVAQE